MSKAVYPGEISKPRFPEIEEKILKFWEDNKIFQKSIEIREKENAPDYVFYDGPPFANGLPHYGHILTGFVKDIVPRYFTMKGFRVPRRFGWDCHGLPAEMEMEKEASIGGKKEIEKYGIGKFNEGCKKLVLKYVDDWARYVKRQGRWIDIEHAYKTMDLSYMESVIWAFKSLYDKGLIYKKDRVVSYCYRCETPLSNFETRMDDATRSRQDPSITVRFKIKDIFQGYVSYFLVWTTTPWTLPSNLAIAVGKKIDYIGVLDEGELYILAKSRYEQYSRIFGDEHKEIWSGKGSELLGINYLPLFDYFLNTVNAFRVLPADFVGTDEGTGIVHCAPGFGEDDQILCNEYDIDTICPVDTKACFTEEVPDYAGVQVFDTNKQITKRLKDEKKLILHETLEHNYPHCWRCNTPLVYRAIPSWYVAVTDIKEDLIKANQEINWIPEHVKYGQFGKWIEGARDWSISRNRYFGAPIPVWICDSCDNIKVFGSIKELEKYFNVEINDLHRPYIDNLTAKCDECGEGVIKRVSDVMDCWFESGSMPYAHVHYPFENKEWFEKYCPADFIVEYIAQTRGWFYTLNVLSVALFNKPSFRNVICHGVILDMKGRKLSKKLRNYPDPMEMFNKHGADPMRWYLVANPILKGGNFLIDNDGRGISETVKNVLLPIWNVYYFFTMYSNIDEYRADFSLESKNHLDRYIFSELRNTLVKVDEDMLKYELYDATEHIRNFIEVLTNWYLRRSRRRFWKSGNDEDKLTAYNTLYSVLMIFTKILAPFLPFLAEYIYIALKNEGENDKISVHLNDWVEPDTLPYDEDLMTKMRTVRKIVKLGHSLRKQENIRVRQPLSCIRISGENASDVLEFSNLIEEELNVKKVQYVDDSKELGIPVLKVNAKLVGPRLGKKVQELIKAGRDGSFKINTEGSASISNEVLKPEEFSIQWIAREGSDCISEGNLVVSLDLELNENLIDEGIARELIRQIQNARAKAGYQVSDRIKASLILPDKWIKAVKRHSKIIMNETLCVDLQTDKKDNEWFLYQEEILGESIQVYLLKAINNI